MHGLNGHREKTWQHDRAQKPWPKEFLADDLGHARLMSYGFDARVVAEWNEFLGKVSNNDIHQHAQNMLEKLALYRDEHSREVSTYLLIRPVGQFDRVIANESVTALTTQRDRQMILRKPRSASTNAKKATQHICLPQSWWNNL